MALGILSATPYMHKKVLPGIVNARIETKIVLKKKTQYLKRTVTATCRTVGPRFTSNVRTCSKK
jgi:hypothetical protein